MPVSRLRHIPGIGVDEIGDAADATGNPRFLRLENLDTDVPPPAIAREVTHAAVEADEANSYLPFQGHRTLREAAAGHVAAISGQPVDPGTECVSVQASRRLFTRAEVAATPMTGWGPSGERYLRLVFANEPVERLSDLRARFDTAFG